jgi:hypothetical protein
VVVRTTLIAFFTQIVAFTLETVEARSDNWRYLASVTEKSLVDCSHLIELKLDLRGVRLLRSGQSH